jgi:uncharacterized protein GlcG (DUF336 family)/quercetin dioxygenase-like cupin family protein
MTKALLLCAAALIAGPACAQTFLPSPTAQEAQAPRPGRGRGIPSALAVEAAQLAVATCAAQGLKVTALVDDAESVPIAMLSADGAAAITQRLAAAKARTSLKTGLPSGEAAARAKTDPAFLATLMADPNIGTPRQGGLPIRAGEQVVGAIAVSGAPTGDRDEPCAKAALAVIGGRLTAVAAAASAPLLAGPLAPSSLNPASVTYVLPKDIHWDGGEAEAQAPVYGDPSKPGPYAYLIRWSPGHNSKPHFHSTDRFIYVISGTWWVSTSKTYDLATMHPIPAGSFVKHTANQVHWDGAHEEPAVLLLTGVGPVTTTQVTQP